MNSLTGTPGWHGLRAARLGLIGLSFAIVLFAAPASQALTLAYKAMLTVDVMDNFFPMSKFARGTVDVDPATGAFSLPADLFHVDMHGEFDETTPRDIIPANVLGVDVLFDSGAGVFGPDPGGDGFGGTMGTPGSFDFYGDLPVPFVLPLILDSLGEGGSDSASILFGLIVTTLVGDPYRTGDATVSGVVVDGIPGQSFIRTGFDKRADDWTGRLRMVAPAHATIDAGDLFRVDVPIFATLDMKFHAPVPEPGTGALVGLGLLCLACRSRRPSS